MIMYLIDVDGELKPFVAPQHRVDGEMVETTKENPMPAEGKDEDVIVIKLDDIKGLKQSQNGEVSRATTKLQQLIDESYKKE